jgi:hypothetical protein
MNTQILLALLGSAAIGALVSNIITLLGQRLERKSRREELAVTKAMEMAHENTRVRMEILKDSETAGLIAPSVLGFEDYYISVKHVLDHGKLDPAMRERVKKQMAKRGIDIDNR